MTDAGFRSELVLAVDWSAASSPKPKIPSPDAPWIAWAFRDEPPACRPLPEYFRTRAACEARIAELVARCAGAVLVGVDFPLGYPLARDGTPVLPVGRDLSALLSSLIQDDDRNANNRFDVAESLNAQIADRVGEPHGPFWGCPSTRDIATGWLLPTKRVTVSIPEYRAVEEHIRATRGLQIQSPWKLYTTGSVGSQMLLGLPMLHRLLGSSGDRGRLWPFEPINRHDAVVFTEIWPSLHDADAADHPIKDARQVVAARDALLACSDPLPDRAPSSARNEGWIAGVQPPSAQPEIHTDA